MAITRIKPLPLSEEQRALGATGFAYGVFLPTSFSAEGSVETVNTKLNLHFDFWTTFRGAECVNMAVNTTNDPGIGISSEVIRAIPIARITKYVVRRRVFVFNEENKATPGADIHFPSELLEEWPRNPSTTFFRYISVIYNLAETLGDGPTAAVATQTGVSRATAGRMVLATRKAGFLEPIIDSRDLSNDPEERSAEIERTLKWFDIRGEIRLPVFPKEVPDELYSEEG